MAGWLTLLTAAAGLRAAEINVDNSLNGGAGGAPVALHHVVVTVYKSRTVSVEKAFTKAIVGSTEIVDVLPISDHTLYLQGKKLGTTNVTVFDADGRLISILDVEVAIDIGEIQQKIQRSTGIDVVHVSATGNQVTLTGLVPDTIVADRALAVAKGLAGDAVVNAMQIAPSQQVMLEVRFLEVARSAGRDLGVNLFLANSSGTRGFNTGAPGTGLPITQAGPVGNGVIAPNNQPLPGNVPIFSTPSISNTLLTTTAGPFATILANVISNGHGSLDALVTALEQKGLIRRLAEPNLVALSGDTARFLAGGEYPVPVPSTTSSGAPTVTVDYKKFGVELAFVPTVLSRGVINLRIEPSVSEPDFTNTVTIQGTIVPTFTVRNTRTTVELRDGQSFAIAGLLQTKNTRAISQVPWIGSVPVLGALFRSSDYQQQETDLVVIVTPHLVAPVAPGQRLASPLDERLPSNDVDFFLNGQPDVRKRYTDFVTSGADLAGPYGHIIAPPNGSGGVQGAVVRAKD
ncbi:MAG TPA: type II and III secretion system protein family protein [Xanthobacteraceae bacterium]|nr:type II and III secretion system protein family protein [Xanthobacteraceae bacterium]